MRFSNTLLALLIITFAALNTEARVLPSDMTPVIADGYTPVDPDERGIWQSSDKIEAQIKDSNLRIRNPELNQYVFGIIKQLLGDSANDIRLYIMRDPNFNASMFPNGMMIVNTGLLSRMRNEAQLAAVLGHEAGHYFRQHTLTRFRDVKTKAAIMSVVALAGAAGSGISNGGSTWYDVARSINIALFVSLSSYSRKQESEADAYGLRLLAESGYSPDAAANVWGQLIEERKASAEARNKRYRDRSRSALSTHPPTEERMTDLALSAYEVALASGDEIEFNTYSEKWKEGIHSIRWSLLDEQVKLNDDGASIHLINSLAEDGWESGFYYYLGLAYSLRGNEGDDELAAEAYASAVEFEEPLAEAYRAHGYAQLKQGNKEAGKEALAEYLKLSPDAADAAMIKFSINQ